jgi:hypothetical protein
VGVGGRHRRPRRRVRDLACGRWEGGGGEVAFGDWRQPPPRSHAPPVPPPDCSVISVQPRQRACRTRREPVAHNSVHSQRAIAGVPQTRCAFALCDWAVAQGTGSRFFDWISPILRFTGLLACLTTYGDGLDSDSGTPGLKAAPVTSLPPTHSQRAAGRRSAVRVTPALPPPPPDPRRQDGVFGGGEIRSAGGGDA